MNAVRLDTQDTIWRFTWRSPDGDKPVEITMSLTGVVDGTWAGEVRITGYPGPITAFRVGGCDWIQAHQMQLSWVKTWLTSHAQSGPLYWRGTSIPFEISAWRSAQRKPRLSATERLRAAWITAWAVWRA